ncbi:MAG: DUF2325 domain-containing protein [Desulfovibrio sp.]|jgi:hypothetical protein|nr:DUF2325 domain-containing protein [Desulfovibrio sp.]
MSAVLIGGMDRLRRVYMLAAGELGIDLKIFTGHERSLRKQIGEPDMIILCTGKVSHSARLRAFKYADENSIPVEMIHSSGVSALKRCLEGRS